MEKYKKLLESNVREDIALGLALCEGEGLLEERDYPHDFKDGFTIQFDDWTVWCSPGFSCIRVRKIGFSGAFRDGRWDGEEFDFRTKKEEEV